MNLLDKIKALAEEKRISISELERKVNVSPNSMYKWKNQIPKIDKLQAVADYFDVSTDYLLGRTEVRNWKAYDDQLTDKHFDLVKEAEGKYTTLNDKEKKDIALQADMLLDGIENGENLNFYGEPATDEQKERLRVAIRTAMAMNKEEAKKKFTRKDYRK